MFFHFIRFGMSIAVIFLVLGCSYTSVGHLQRQPWVLNTPQQLEMRFWKFSFVAEFSDGHYVLTGIAEPRIKRLPEGLTWIEDLWLAAYLSDDRGRVLAQDLLVFSSLPLMSSQGVSFTFVLKPDQLSRSAPLEITFGYNMTLTPHADYATSDEAMKPLDGEAAQIFFAHEGALTKI
ncbi:MAG TPA: hypothetical protein ENN39_09955 [Desulfonatronum sp.]|nr:hypothetical protein [Desulfonatronum sp.]